MSDVDEAAAAAIAAIENPSGVGSDGGLVQIIQRCCCGGHVLFDCEVQRDVSEEEGRGSGGSIVDRARCGGVFAWSHEVEERDDGHIAGCFVLRARPGVWLGGSELL